MTMMMISMITVRILVAGNSYNEIAENATYRPQHFNVTNQIELHLLTYCRASVCLDVSLYSLITQTSINVEPPNLAG